MVTNEVTHAPGNSGKIKATPLLWKKREITLKQLISSSTGLVAYKEDGSEKVMQEVPLCG